MDVRGIATRAWTRLRAGTYGSLQCDLLLALARKLDPEALGATSLSGQVVVRQLRVAVVDLLEGLGLPHDRARNALPVLAA